MACANTSSAPGRPTCSGQERGIPRAWAQLSASSARQWRNGVTGASSGLLRWNTRFMCLRVLSLPVDVKGHDVTHADWGTVDFGWFEAPLLEEATDSSVEIRRARSQ